VRLSVRSLSKSYRDADSDLTIINSLNYDFPEKGSLAIVGRSGVGKSTLLHLLGGLDRVTSGKILYDTVDIAALSVNQLTAFRGKKVGFIFQFHHLLPEFSALENVAMPLLVQGVTEEEARSRASEILDKVGMNHRLSHRPGTLSGGEQQRVAIARAVVHHPDAILADEPTGNLDFRTAREVQELLLAINAELNNVLVVVTHSDDLAQSMQHVVEMSPGGSLERWERSGR